MPAKKGRRRLRGAAARRWVAVGVLVLVGLLYYRPLHAYLEARGQRATREAAVQRLRDEQATLRRRLQASSSLRVLEREARTLGFVRAGEHLFIVKNTREWRRKQRLGNAPRHDR
ncbi:MAG TPA: septum formation initiator family protein [Gaiellaceae bacterium]|nr:septum formation initiator family protein [Gaiellaceae bacterium]